MMIAIHATKGDFSERWIQYCLENNIEFKAVCCYDSDIIEQVKECDALMWHHNHASPKDVIFAKQLLFALQSTGKAVFPDFNTSWHSDDKLGQKYLLEAIHASFAPAYAFYSKKDALNWIGSASFPKVFKLRGGAGSENVKLVKHKKHAVSLVKTAFGKGFRQFDVTGDIKEKIRKRFLGKASILEILKAVAHLVYPYQVEKTKNREKGYIYFQKFIPGNTYDTRVIVIGNKAFAIKRMVRQNDFRASGSGNIVYDKNQIDTRCLESAFEISRRLYSQCLAFDYISDKGFSPFLVEISFGFYDKAYDVCPGYWDDKLQWFEGSFNPYGWMVEGIISRVKESPKIK